LARLQQLKDLVVRHIARLLRAGSRRGGARRGSVVAVLRGVRQLPASAVGAQAERELGRGGAALDPVVHGPAHAQRVACHSLAGANAAAKLDVLLRGVEVGVAARAALPATVEVVGHEVDEVQVLIHGSNVVRVLDRAFPHADRGSQQQRVAGIVSHKLLLHHAEHRDVVLIVILHGPEGLLVAVVPGHHRVLPVQVETVEAPLAAEVDDVAGEGAGALLGCGDRREDLAGRRSLAVGGAGRRGAVVEVPAADADQALDARILALHADRQALVASQHAGRAARPIAALAARLAPVRREGRIVARVRAEAILQRMAARVVSIGVVAGEAVAAVAAKLHACEAVHEVRAQVRVHTQLEDVLALVDQARAVACPVCEVAHVDATVGVG